MKLRLDAELVRQGFFATQKEAYASVLAGEVSGESMRYDHPGMQVKEGIRLHVKHQIDFASRGGYKLSCALTQFHIDPKNLSCLDIGASTGGFTDCLLEARAASVVSVDVGYAQFSWRLRNDARVCLLERTNICDVPDLYPDMAFDLAVCDVSFTSLTTITPAVRRLLKNEGLFISLIKPQFEVAREFVPAGGVITDKALHASAIAKACTACHTQGLQVFGICESPIHGKKGNREFLLIAKKCSHTPNTSGESSDTSAVFPSCEVIDALVYDGKATMDETLSRT